MIQSNVINSSFKNGVKNLIFLGSSCVYPKTFLRPIKETDLLSNYLEQTNEPYAIAKIAGIKLCEALYNQYNLDVAVVMPTNVYGINDRYSKERSHVIPALVLKFLKAKTEY